MYLPTYAMINRAPLRHTPYYPFLPSTSTGDLSPRTEVPKGTYLPYLGS